MNNSPYLTPGSRFHAALLEEKPLQIVGVVNAYAAKLAERSGFKALYLSGGGVAAASYGMPDLGITTLNDVLEDVKRITDATPLPLLVDIDTGWGNAFNIARTIKQMQKAQAAGVHIEDQVQAKRCGHRPRKALVSAKEMSDRIKAAVDAKIDSKFVIMARTDALAVEGLPSSIERALAYVEAGADMIFFEGATTLEEYQQFTAKVTVPVLANITEFGVTPLFTRDQLSKVGVSIILYPLSAFRAMSTAALKVYQTIRKDGTQQSMINTMQTRDELYEFLNYHDYENKLDELFAKEGE
jgi:methylisocitrate lyase